MGIYFSLHCTVDCLPIFYGWRPYSYAAGHLGRKRLSHLTRTNVSNSAACIKLGVFASTLILNACVGVKKILFDRKKPHVYLQWLQTPEAVNVVCLYLRQKNDASCGGQQFRQVWRLYYSYFRCIFPKLDVIPWGETWQFSVCAKVSRE